MKGQKERRTHVKHVERGKKEKKIGEQKEK